MGITKEKLERVIEELNINDSFNKVKEFKSEKYGYLKTIPSSEPHSKKGQNDRIDFLKESTGVELKQLKSNPDTLEDDSLKGNIENFIGHTSIPTGVLGPLIVNGTSASGGYYVPLATSEGALVASYARGARACRDSGAITSVCIMEGVQRCPSFKFDNLLDLGQFVAWVMSKKEAFQEVTSKSSRYAQLSSMEMNVEGNQVILILEYTTGDAAGQNMVTICTDQICRYIISESPIKPTIWFIESNYSGDKKATSNSFNTVRGKKVTAEIVLKREVINEVLKTSPELMEEYWKTSFIGAVKCGAIGAQGHFANGLAALFLACGQDVACVSEASVGITRMEINEEGDLYCSVTMPNLIVGSVGGGTSLATQKECLQLMGCYGAGNGKKIAEISAALCLAGEISIIAAMSAGHFASAHKNLGRK